MRFAFKAVVVFFLTLGLLIPLMLIRGTIQEREAYRAQAVANVAATSAGKQAVLGPVLVVPYVELVEQDEVTPQGIAQGVARAGGQVDVLSRNAGGRRTMKPDTRKRGLYRVPVYELRHARGRRDPRADSRRWRDARGGSGVRSSASVHRTCAVSSARPR